MRLALRGLWWRRGSSLVVLLAIVLSIAGAVAGPLFSRAAAESALRVRLDQAPSGDRGIRISTQDAPTAATLRALNGWFPAALAPYFANRLPTMQLHTTVLTGEGVAGVSDLTWRPGFCSHLTLVSGRCPHGLSEVIVSERTVARGDGVVAGGTVDVATPHPMRVVGVYRPRNLNDAFWFGENYFDAHPYQGGGDGPDTLDSMFVDESAIASAASAPFARVWVDFYLAPQRIRLDNVPRLATATAALIRRYPPLSEPSTQTRLPQLLRAAAHDREVLDEGCLVVTVQLVLLAWLVLHHIITGTSEARGMEISAAKLRGWRPAAVARFALAENAMLLAAGVPLGLLAGYVATRLLAAASLTAGTPVLVRASPVVAAAIAATGAAVAAVAATSHVLRRPILAQWRRADAQLAASGRGGLVRDIAIGLLAVAGLYLLRATGALDGGRPQVAGLFAPGLFIVAVAKLGTRIVPAIGRLAVRRSRASSRVATFLAVRQVARRRDGLGASALLAVAVGLAVFAVAAMSVIGANQKARASAEVGAAQVVVVQPQPGTDLVKAVDAVDPQGTWAMAVAAWQPVGGNVTGQVYAVQTDRLAKVAYWDHAWGPADLAGLQRALTPTNAPSVSIQAQQLRVTLTAARTDHDHPAPTLAVRVADRSGHTTLVTGARISGGTRTYALSTPCLSGCRLLDIEVYRDIDDFGTLSGSITVHSIAQRASAGWQPVDARLTVPNDWRAGPVSTDGFVNKSIDASGVRMDYSVAAGGWPTVEVADYSRPLPVAVARHAQGGRGTLYVGELGEVTPLDPVARARILPRALDAGVLTDLALATAQLPAFDTAVQQVWLSPSAPHDALARLRAAGLTTGDPDALSAHLLALRSQGPAQTLNLLAFASIVACLLALAATALSTALTARRRAFELAALRSAGIQRGTLLASSVVEQLLLLAIGAGLGTAAALVVFGLSESSVPQFSDVTAVPLTYAANPIDVAVLIVVIAALVIAGALLAGRLLLRAAVPTLLREAAP